MKTDFVDFVDPQKHKEVAPFGPYDRAIDFLGDGSFYLVDSPGDLAGRLGAVARIAPNSFVFLAGGARHNRLCYDPGERLISGRVHQDVDAARKTVGWLKKLNVEYPNVIIILTHEKERVREMPLFPDDDLKQWAVREIEKRITKSAL